MTNLRCLQKSDLRMLDPRGLRLSRDAFGRLKLCLRYEERYEPVKVVRALPLTDPERYISFQDEEGEEIGVLEEIQALEREAQTILREELDLVYLKAEVKGIRKVDPRQGLISWDLDTSLGPRTIYLKDRSDIRPLPDGRIILTDVHGAKYQIPPVEQLDDRSRSWLEIEM